jgi:hypothetical protein
LPEAVLKRGRQFFALGDMEQQIRFSRRIGHFRLSWPA